jgi:hypothetical protein
MQRLRFRHGRRLIAAGAVAVATPAGLALALGGGESAGVSFAADVQPIFDTKCVVCHPTSYEYLDLRPGRSYLDLVRVSSALQPAFERVLPGRPELSFLLTHVPDPSREGLLSADDERVIATWIAEGARDN